MFRISLASTACQPYLLPTPSPLIMHCHNSVQFIRRTYIDRFLQLQAAFQTKPKNLALFLSFLPYLPKWPLPMKFLPLVSLGHFEQWQRAISRLTSSSEKQLLGICYVASSAQSAITYSACMNLYLKPVRQACYYHPISTGRN